ncbi:MAG: hypothetical protein OTI36_20580, partial [Beijerinckiaceae bacterium]|nr:hypothetical protein [Beijerinckiaceae bacterium]
MSSGLVFRFLRRLGVVAMLGLATTLTVAGTADARLGGGFSSGSRASRTWSAPAATPTAPSVAPFQ